MKGFSSPELPPDFEDNDEDERTIAADFARAGAQAKVPSPLGQPGRPVPTALGSSPGRPATFGGGPFGAPPSMQAPPAAPFGDIGDIDVDDDFDDERTVAHAPGTFPLGAPGGGRAPGFPPFSPPASSPKPPSSPFGAPPKFVADEAVGRPSGFLDSRQLFDGLPPETGGIAPPAGFAPPLTKGNPLAQTVPAIGVSASGAYTAAQVTPQKAPGNPQKLLLLVLIVALLVIILLAGGVVAYFLVSKPAP